MIEERVLRKKPAKITLICDIVEQRGLPLLKSFVVSQAPCTEHIILLLLDAKQTDFPNVENKHTTVKVISDPLCWLSAAGESGNPMQELISAIDPVKESRVTVVIDSLTSLILMRSMPYTCCLMHKVALLGKDVEVVGLVHEDCHDPDSLAQLQSCATTIFRLLPPTSPPVVTANCLHKENSGKIQRKKEQFRLDGNFQLTETRELSSVAEHLQQAMLSVASAEDPTANLTFNLSLSDKEKADRKQVPLPYMHQTKQSAKIFYQPDDADDFDEEDPDDDLDI